MAALFILDAYAMFAILLIGKTDVSINITSERANETKKYERLILTNITYKCILFNNQ